MRNSILQALMDIAEADIDMVVLTGDLGFGLFEPFIELYPGQFFNLGIGEQNMIGVAAGLALSGKKVFVYSIGNFPSFRCLEQIRNDLCYHNLNVNILSIGGGFNYGGLGMSHHATEDLSAMRMLPNMTLVAPSNGVDAASALHALYKRSGPSYLRLEKLSKFHSVEQRFSLGKAKELAEGKECCIIAIGSILNEALAAAEELLLEYEISCGVIDMHTLKPLDKNILKSIFERYKLIITLEENTLIGGLYGAISEFHSSVLSDSIVIGMGIRDQYSTIVGDQQYLREYYKLDKNAVVNTITKEYAKNIHTP